RPVRSHPLPQRSHLLRSICARGHPRSPGRPLRHRRLPLPRSLGNAQRRTHAAGRNDDVGAAMTTDARRLQVLVVDDSAVVRQALTAILTHAGFDVTTAPDPIIAGERLRTFTPDVMVLDLEMPRMDGIS